MLISSFIISIAGNVWYNFQFTTWQLATSKLVDYLGITILFYFLAISVAEYTHLSTIKINTLEKNNRTEKPKVITVRDGKKVVIVKTSSILWIKSDKPYIAIYTEEGKYLHNSSLRDVLKELNDANFVRIHRSTIVNVSKIDKLISRLNGDYDVVMESSQKLRLSRTYKNNLNDQLLSSST
ncbi:MAG: LytTR family transcriptional regulator [Balneola sp.]